MGEEEKTQNSTTSDLKHLKELYIAAATSIDKM
jgi:hypothetical protein